MLKASLAVAVCCCCCQFCICGEVIVKVNLVNEQELVKDRYGDGSRQQIWTYPDAAVERSGTRSARVPCA